MDTRLPYPIATAATFVLLKQRIETILIRTDPRQRLDFALIVERRLRRPDRFADDLPRQTKVTSDRLDRLTRCMLTPNPNHCLHDQHPVLRSEEHTSELQSLMRISYAVFC